MRELLAGYGPVGCIWFDGHWEASWTQVDGGWQRLAAGTTMGGEWRLESGPVKARRFRLNIRKAVDTPTLAEFRLMRVP